MNGLSKMAATALLLVLAIVPAAMAVTHMVGETSGWVIGLDYTGWVKGKTFRVGDTLEFKYSRIYSVGVVDKTGYDYCDVSYATEIHYDGDTKIELNTAGPKYYICVIPGHCADGMKLAVTVLPAYSGTQAALTLSSSTPATPSTLDSPVAGTPATPTPASGSSSLLLLHQRI